MLQEPGCGKQKDCRNQHSGTGHCTGMAALRTGCCTGWAEAGRSCCRLVVAGTVGVGTVVAGIAGPVGTGTEVGVGRMVGVQLVQVREEL